MKPSRSRDTNRSCSCTSCFYKSGSENPSVQDMLIHGSKIDRLYLGKYIPMREQKLLHKLIRTRGVYDDIRKQLLSETDLGGEIDRMSTLHLSKQNKELDESDRSSIFQLVNLVDKGAVGQAQLSDCCSCCSCDSTFKLQRRKAGVDRRRRSHTGFRTEMYEKRVSRHEKHKGARKRSRSSMYLGDEISVHKKQREGHRVKQNAKRKFGGNIKRAYHTMESGMGETVRKTATKIIESKMTIGAGIKKSLQHLKNTENIIQETISENFKNFVQNVRTRYGSKDLTDDDLVELFENTFYVNLRDSLIKYEDEEKQRKILEKWACDFECDSEICTPAECFQKKKQSISKTRGKGKGEYETKIKKTETKKSKNTPPDILSQAKNEEITVNTHNNKMKNANMTKKVNTKRPRADKKANKQTGGKDRTGRHEYIQKKMKGKSKVAHVVVKTKSVKSISNLPSKSSRVTVQPVVISPQKTTEKQATDKKLKEHSDKSPSGGERHASKIGLPVSSNIEIYKHKSTLNVAPDVKHKMHRKNKATASVQKRVRHTVSSSSRSVGRDAKPGDYDLRRCACTLKLKSRLSKSRRSKPNLQKSVKSESKSLQTMKSQISSLPLNKLHPYECEPMICTPGACDPIECDKRIKQRYLKRRSIPTSPQYPNHRSHSTPNIPTRTVAIGEVEKPLSNIPRTVGNKRKPVQREPVTKLSGQNIVPQRQAVRIGSTFSFNIEFYRGDSSKRQIQAIETRRLPIQDTLKFEKKPKRAVKRQNQAVHTVKHHLANKLSQNSYAGKSKQTITKHNLRRCFCTMKIAKQGGKPQVQTLTQGTLTSGKHVRAIEKNLLSADKATGKKNINDQNEMKLLPYECEPGICVPGECNPYDCQKIINDRFVTQSAKGIGTEHRISKSTYSITKKPLNLKTKQVQSVLINPNTQGKQEHKIRKPRIAKYSSSNLNRQAVTIGSSFHFDVEFFKDKSPSSNLSSRYEKKSRDSTRKSSVYPKRKTVQKKRRPHKQINKNEGQQKRAPEQTEKIRKLHNRDFNSTLKQCFCTLKMHKLGKSKKEPQMATAGTEIEPELTFEGDRHVMSTKGTKTRRMLEPYECEPYSCIPGDCDPYQCLQKIKMREKFKGKNFGTSTSKNKMKSMSSITTSSSLVTRNTQIQFEPNLKKKKRNRSTYTITDNIKTTSEGGKSSRQAVKISSKLSFDIEFYKDRFSQKDFERAQQNLKPVAFKNKNESPLPRSMKTHESQSPQVKKLNKALGIRPILKRCFCTLKLQNKNRTREATTIMNPRNIEATVMPAQVFYKNINISKHKSDKTLITKQDYCNFYRSDSLASTTHCLSQNHITSELNTCKLSSTSISQINLKKIPFANVVYAMNLKANRDRVRYKLEPYECEPGVCVPGQCDPIECQKRIMKRLMKRDSTMTPSEKRSESISSDTTYLYPKSKSKKIQSHEHVAKRNGARKLQKIKNTTLPQNSKHTVRVGSSFSFNIEFSKDKSADVDISKIRKSSITSTHTSYNRKYRTKGTRGKRLRNQETESQSSFATHHKRSGITADYTRCFCTLKLQKKGKNQNGTDVNFDTKLPVNTIKTTTTGQNTKKIARYNTLDLDPNECEPYVCIPDECDPYTCLERIRKRNFYTKNSGTEVQSCRASVSTITDNINKSSAAKYSQYNHGAPKSRSVKKTKFIYGDILKDVKPSRQAVRIGSSFSFDVEFYKDKKPILNNENSSAIIHRRKRVGDAQTAHKNIYRRPTKSIQSFQSYHNRNLQVTTPTKHESTKTASFLKRCFCTAILQKPTEGYIKPHLGNQVPKVKMSKLEKMHTPKVIETKSTCTNSPTVQILPNIRDAYNKTQPYDLRPYECEPGVCTPGQCNPYECEKLMKKRFRRDSATLTQKYYVRSTSTGDKNAKKLRDRQIQLSQFKHIPKIGKHENYSSDPKNVNSDKQIVRIGSNFSFNVEFFKDITPGPNIVRSNETRSKKVQETAESKTNKGTLKHTGKIGHRQTQSFVQKTESKASGVGPLLKRCFCTLKLQNIGKEQHQNAYAPLKNYKDVSIATKACPKVKYKDALFKETGTKTRKIYPHLEPYECEPGICMPGNCDPIECYERIKRRNLKTSGTETKKYHTRSVCCSAVERKPLIKKIQTLPDNTLKQKVTRSHTRISKRPDTFSTLQRNRQCVRIDSTFNISVDFFKEHSPGDFKRRTLIDDNNEIESVSKGHGDRKSKIKTVSHGSCQNKPFAKHKEIQTHTLKKDVGSGMLPLLKRCFCTLSLQKTKNKHTVNTKQTVSNNIVHMPLNINSQDKSSQAKFKNKKVRNTPKNVLDPFECEPGVCNPGQCNPYECLDRIKRREIRRQSRTVETGRICSKSCFTATDFGSYQTMSKNVQSYPPWIVEEPRFPLLNPKNWQGVKFGSNVSINIEFYKDLCNNIQNINGDTISSAGNYKNDKTNNYTNKTSKSTHTQNKLNDCQIQAKEETETKASATGKALKRCFCTAKLHQLEAKTRGKQVFNVRRVDDVQTLTPFQPIRNSKLKKRRNKGNNNDHINNVGITIDNPSEIVVVPKSKQVKGRAILNKFSKRNATKDVTSDNLTVAEISGDYLTKTMSVSYDPNTKKEMAVLLVSGTDVDIKLKKDKINTKYSKKTKKTQSPNDRPIYKCNDTCPYCKILSKQLYVSQNKPGKKLGTKLNKETKRHVAGKNVATNVNEKYLNKKVQQDKTKTNHDYNKTQKDMETILPYKPRKFNKKESKTLIRRQYEPDHYCCSKCFCQKSKNYPKVITNSQNLISDQNKTLIKQPSIKRLLCACLPKFMRHKDNDENNDIRLEDKPRVENLPPRNAHKTNLKRSKSDRCPQKVLPEATTSKSVRVTKTQANIKNMSNTKKISKKCAQMRSDYAGKKQDVLIERKLLCNCDELHKIGKNKTVTFSIQNDVHKKTKTNSKNTSNMNKHTELVTNSETTCARYHSERKRSVNSENFPYNHYNACIPQKPTEYSIVKISGKALQKDVKPPRTPNESTVVTVSGTDISCEIDRRKHKYDTTCFRCKHINSKEFPKLKNEPNNKALPLVHDKNPKQNNTIKADKRTHKLSIKLHKKTPFNNHDGPCCCNKIPNDEGAKFTKNGKQLSPRKDEDKKNVKPCLCGSKICAVESKKEPNKTKLVKKAKTNPCVCGSPACKRLAQLASSNANGMKALATLMKLNKNVCLCGGKTCECAIYLKKMKLERSREVMKELAKRRAKYHKEDKLRRKKRIMMDKKLMKQVKKYRNASDLSLITESVIDIGRLGCSALGDITRSTYKTLSDPRNSYEVMKAVARNPKRGCDMCSNALAQSSVSAVCKRLGYRCIHMKCTKKAKSKLEEYDITNYLLHMLDKNPKHRIKRKKKKIRKREPMDFQCSLYMASLRKRPFLAVYYACPWFYPHCITLLNVWRQLTDVVLFLLAFVVWSPCILTMELCRALMCCTLCTA